ncbi:MAG: hypothetical protein QXU98_14385 [Candidatus Parvarchaeota archaeon]
MTNEIPKRKVQGTRTSVKLTPEIIDFFNEHREYNMSEFIRIAISEKIERMKKERNQKEENNASPAAAGN